MLGAKNVNPIDYMPYEKAATIKPPQEISLTDLRRLWENG